MRSRSAARRTGTASRITHTCVGEQCTASAVAPMFGSVRKSHLWRNWIAANAVGELLGLGVAVAITVGVARAHALPPAAEILVVTAAFLVIGVYEGAIVGAAQWLVLRRVLPSVGAKQWVVATVVGAVIAWMLGRIPNALADWNGVGTAEPGMPMILFFGAAMGAALGLILGGAQWLVLRDHVRRAGIWVGANALAWAIGMPLILLAAGIPSNHTSVLTIGALAMVAVSAAGAVVGAVEGAFLRILLQTPR